MGGERVNTPGCPHSPGDTKDGAGMGLGSVPLAGAGDGSTGLCCPAGFRGRLRDTPRYWGDVLGGRNAACKR